jgi:DNA modification methylase
MRMLELNRCYCADAVAGLKQLEAESVNCCVTSPPYYGLRDYGVAGQIGLEPSPEGYISRMVEIFREVWRVLRDDGTLWLNMGDSYANDGKWGGKTGGKQAYLDDNNRKRVGREKSITGLPPKSLIGIPWMLAFALRADGWILRQDIIWAKPNPMPESVRDRCTKAHEYIFLLSKSPHYYFDAEAIREPAGDWHDSLFQDGKNLAIHPNVGKQARSGNAARKYGDERGRPSSHLGASVPWEGNTRNKRDVWTISTKPFKEAHFATFPPELIKPCILAGCSEGGTVCDPFMGSGTTLVTANELDRNCIGFDLNPDYCDMANRRRDRAMAQQSLFRKEIKDS